MRPKKHIWTPALDEELRRIYAEHSRSRKNLIEALQSFRRRLGWPRSAVTNRARQLRITCFEKYAWSKEEDDLLRELAGSKSINAIHKQVGRTWQSVKNRL
jgi:hypothetical protein